MVEPAAWISLLIVSCTTIIRLPVIRRSREPEIWLVLCLAPWHFLRWSLYIEHVECVKALKANAHAGIKQTLANNRSRRKKYC